MGGRCIVYVIQLDGAKARRDRWLRACPVGWHYVRSSISTDRSARPARRGLTPDVIGASGMLADIRHPATLHTRCKLDDERVPRPCSGWRISRRSWPLSRPLSHLADRMPKSTSPSSHFVRIAHWVDRYFRPLNSSIDAGVQICAATMRPSVTPIRLAACHSCFAIARSSSRNA